MSNEINEIEVVENVQPLTAEAVPAQVIENKTARKRAVFTDPYATAELKPVIVNDNIVNRKAVVLPDENGAQQTLSIMGMDYQLIQNSICRDVADDVMTRSDYDWDHMKCLFDGKRFTDMWYSKNEIMAVGNGDNHPIHLGLMVRNAYDGSSAFGFEIFAVNMKCTNQYISRNRFGYFALRHTASQAGSWDVNDALLNIGNAAQRVIGIAPVLKAMQQKELQTMALVQATKSIERFPTSKWGSVLEKIEAPTVFGLFQAMTDVASHDVDGFRQINLGDMIGQYFLPAA